MLVSIGLSTAQHGVGLLSGRQFFFDILAISSPYCSHAIRSLDAVTVSNSPTDPTPSSFFIEQSQCFIDHPWCIQRDQQLAICIDLASADLANAGSDKQLH